MLPEDEPLRWLMSRAHYGDKPICPTPFAYHEDLEEALQAAADLEAWGVSPAEGPPCDWPAGLPEALRHIRGVNGLLQIRQMRKKK